MKTIGKKRAGLLAILTAGALLLTACGQSKEPPVSGGEGSSSAAGDDNLFEFGPGNGQVGDGQSAPEGPDGTGSRAPSPGKTTSGKDTTPTAGEGKEKPLFFPAREGIKGEIVVFLNFTPEKSYYDNFKKIYPNTTIKPIVAQWETQQIKLSQQIQSGVYPDYIMSGAAILNLYMKNYFQPVDPYIGTVAQTMDLDAMKQCVTYDGKMYAVLLQRNPYLLFYNTDMFKSAGLKTPFDLWKENKWTWKTFREYAADLTNQDKGVFGFGTDWEEGFLLSAGTGLVKRTDDVNAVLNIDDPLFREALLFYYDGVNKDKIFGDTRWGNLNDFINGKIAMVYTRFGDYATMEKQGMKAYGVAPFPKYSDAVGYVGDWESDGWSIGRKAKNPEGGMAFGEYVLNRGVKNRNPQTPVDRGTFNDEQTKMIGSIKKSMDWTNTYGCYDTFYQAFGNFMRRNGDFAALLEENRPIWTRAIQNTIAGK